MKLAQILSQLPSHKSSIGVFVNQTADSVLSDCKDFQHTRVSDCGPDTLNKSVLIKLGGWKMYPREEY